MKIVVLEANRIGKDVSFDCLNDFGELIIYDETISAEECRKRTKDADIVIVDQFPLNETTLCDARHLKYVTMTSTGTDFVDFSYMKKRNITVANIRNYSTHSVAQTTIALLLYLYEKLAHFDRYVRNGTYIGDESNSSFSEVFHELYGKEYGIIGMGNIGREVAKIATAFGCHVSYYSPSGHDYQLPYPLVDFDTILSRSDIISVHTPLNAQTKELLDYKAFQKMKKSAVLINTARGGLINEADLVKALKENLIAGAGLDVLTNEPMLPDCPFTEILAAPNLLITPHIGWASSESRSRAIEEIYHNIKAYLNKEDRNFVSA